MEYRDLENELLEALGLCGCGIPETVIALYGDALKAIRERSAQAYSEEAPRPFADRWWRRRGRRRLDVKRGPMPNAHGSSIARVRASRRCNVRVKPTTRHNVNCWLRRLL